MHGRSHEVRQANAFVATVELLYIYHTQVAAREDEDKHEACRG